MTITDPDLLSIEASCSNLQTKLNSGGVTANPFCYPDLQLKTDWTSQADSPGTHGSCTILPATLTTPMKVSFTPASRPQGQLYDNCYILHRNAGINASLFAYVVSVMFPSQQGITNCDAFEMDFQQNTGSTIFNLGWQALFGTGWRIWDRSLGAWEDSGIALPSTQFVPNVPTLITNMFSRTADSVTYVGMSINGGYTPLNVTYPAIEEAQAPYLNNAVQVDSKGKGAPINLCVNACTILGF